VFIGHLAVSAVSCIWLCWIS